MNNDDAVYIKVGPPNHDKLAELTRAAMGGRTQKQFAIDCGVQPSTITRLLKQSNKGASTLELIQAIAKNAHVDSGVSFDALLEANGMSYRQDYKTNNTEHIMLGILTEEIAARGATVYIDYGKRIYNVTKTFRLIPDAVISTNAFGGNNQPWAFEFLPLHWSRPPVNEDYPISIQRLKTVSDKAFDTICRYSFLTVRKDISDVPTHFSLIVSRKEAFEQIIHDFGEMEVPNNTTIILMDLYRRKIVCEAPLLRMDGKTSPSFFNDNTQKLDKYPNKERKNIHERCYN